MSNSSTNSVAIAGRITKKMIKEGIENELINVIANPCSLTHIYEPVCKIGSFFFILDGDGTDTITNFYFKNSKKSIIDKIYENINKFKEDGDKGIVEYNYYYFYITDNLKMIKNPIPLF